jgi:DNA mismatch repair protein MutS2
MTRARVARQRLEARAERNERLAVRPLLRPSPILRSGGHGLEALPDLLHPEPLVQVDSPSLCASLDFAFAGGGCIDVLEHLLEAAPLAPTSWQEECFAADLFLSELVASCMRVEIDGSRQHLNERVLVRLLAHPPEDRATVTFRRAVLSELADDVALRRRFEALYRLLVQFRRCFDDTGTSRYETTQRRIDALTVLRDVVAAMRALGGTKSGLERVGTFAEEIAKSEGHARLVELLDYENDMARVDVRMHVGSDGRVRRFQIVHLEESKDNRFYASPLGRFVTRIVLWWRGYGFSRNELVNRWLDQVFQGLSHFLPPVFQMMGHMELYLAALALRDRCAAEGLPVCFPELVDEGVREVEGLYNPLLFAQGVRPIPCDLGGASFDATTIVTGPNSGGKTRLLQGIAVAQLLAQAGLWVPATKARFRWASGMFVSLIDEPRADQKEGRLGTELMRIRRLFEHARPGAMVILDELCSGTNPSEGEEIFLVVLRLLRELSPEVFISTHFLAFAQRLEAEERELGLEFLQVELDDLQHPTFAFVPGVATTSLAAQTAARLGVTREELLALVRRHRR